MLLKKFYLLWEKLNNNSKRKVILIFSFSFLGAILEAASIGLILPIFNILNSGKYPSILINMYEYINLSGFLTINAFLILLTIFLFLVKNFVLCLLCYFSNKFSSNIRQYFSNKMFNNYITSKYENFLQNNSSLFSKNLTLLISQFNSVVLVPGVVMITEIFVLILITSVSLYVDPISSLILFFLIFVPSIFYFQFTKNKNRHYGQLIQKSDEKRIKVVNEMIGGIRDIRILKNSLFFKKNYYQYEKITAESIFKNVFFLHSTKYYLEFILILSISILLIYNFVIGNSFVQTLTTLTFYGVVSFRLIPSFSRLITALQSLKFGEEIVDIINNEINAKDNIANSTLQFKPMVYEFKNSISIENLSFGYHHSNENLILENVNLKIKKGESIAVLGRTGSGKTTFVNLILGLVQPLSGNLKIDNHKLSSKFLSNKIIFGYVPQDIYLLDDSIKKNIAFALPDKNIDKNKLKFALDNAMLKDFVNTLDHGVNTFVGDRGVKLSGGQRQRIGIARALYSGAGVLIFDEATSALDNETEKEIMKNIYSLKGKFTLIIIAHRISTLSGCDKCYELKENNLKLVKLKNEKK